MAAVSRKVSLAAVALWAWVGAAHADGTAAQAARAFEESYAAYFGRTVLDKGIVKATADGASVVVVWDLQKAAEALDAPPNALKIGPFSYRLTPGDDGVWTLNSDALPRIEFDAPQDRERVRGVFDFDGFALEGRWDPNREPFLTSRLKLAALNCDLTNLDPDNATRVHIAESDITFDLRAQSAVNGGVDVAMANAAGAMSETVRIGDAPPDASNFVAIDASGASGVVAASALKAQEIGQFWRYAVAHQDDRPAARRAFELANAALPLWNEIGGQAVLRGVKARSTLGAADIKSLGESFTSSGLVDEGKLQFGFDFQDLAVNFPGAPPWAASLTPASLKIAFGVSDSGVGKAARLLLTDPSAGNGGVSPETSEAMDRAIRDGHPKLILAPSRLKTPAIDLAFQGEAELKPEIKSARLKVSADSLDKAMAIVADLAQDQPDMRQALLTLSLFKGLAKTDADGRMSWDVVVEGDAVSVNGAPLSGGGGGVK